MGKNVRMDTSDYWYPGAIPYDDYLPKPFTPITKVLRDEYPIDWLAERPEFPDKTKSDGGPSNYYDLPNGAITLNDLLEHLAYTRWAGDTLHLKDTVKAAWRWGEKDGTDKPYDCRKIIYSGARLLMKYAGVKELRKTLQGMLDDPQFQDRE